MLRCQLPVTARLSHRHVHPSNAEQSLLWQRGHMLKNDTVAGSVDNFVKPALDQNTFIDIVGERKLSSSCIEKFNNAAVTCGLHLRIAAQSLQSHQPPTPPLSGRRYQILSIMKNYLYLSFACFPADWNTFIVMSRGEKLDTRVWRTRTLQVISCTRVYQHLVFPLSLQNKVLFHCTHMTAVVTCYTL